jgi:hypothetical protein
MSGPPFILGRQLRIGFTEALRRRRGNCTASGSSRVSARETPGGLGFGNYWYLLGICKLIIVIPALIVNCKKY